MEEYCYTAKDSNTDIQFWSLKEKPLEIKEAVSDGYRNAQIAEDKFIAKLESEKDNFIHDLRNLQEAFSKV